MGWHFVQVKIITVHASVSYISLEILIWVTAQEKDESLSLAVLHRNTRLKRDWIGERVHSIPAFLWLKKRRTLGLWVVAIASSVSV